MDCFHLHGQNIAGLDHYHCCKISSSVGSCEWLRRHLGPGVLETTNELAGEVVSEGFEINLPAILRRILDDDLVSNKYRYQSFCRLPGGRENLRNTSLFISMLCYTLLTCVIETMTLILISYRSYP